MMTKENNRIRQAILDMQHNLLEFYPSEIYNNLFNYLSQHPVMQEGKDEIEYTTLKVGFFEGRFPCTDEIE
jgi:hypothetical protein